MPRYYSARGIELLTLDAAKTKDLTWDVFVSHTTREDDLATEVAISIQSQGLTTWVDSDYLAADHDGPEMASKIQEAINRSYCLLAIVTNATKESWWVPFEIGVAWDRNKYLSTYGVPQMPLPSFLIAWPHVEGREGLRLWCEDIRKKKEAFSPYSHRTYTEVVNKQRSSYVNDMRALARRFPAPR